MKEIVLDTETTGISIKDGHRIVEIGCIELENLIPTKNKFHCYLNPERKVSEKGSVLRQEVRLLRHCRFRRRQLRKRTVSGRRGQQRCVWSRSARRGGTFRCQHD